jgi:hypothetical protein
MARGGRRRWRRLRGSSGRRTSEGDDGVGSLGGPPRHSSNLKTRAPTSAAGGGTHGAVIGRCYER